MNNLKNHFDNQLKRSGKKITINNNICCYAFFKEIKDKEYIDTKYMYADASVNIQQGDIIDCIGQKWIVVQQQENYNNVYSIYTVRRLNNQLKFKFADGVYSIDVIVEDSIQSITGIDVQLVEGKIQIKAQSNNITKHLIEGIRFILYGRAFEIEAFTQTEKNIVKFYCQKGQIQTNLDDLENEIAYNENLNKISVSDKYEIATTGDANLDLKEGESKVINIEFKKNNIIDADPKVEYIYDSNYVKFDENTKTITGIKEGNTDFKIIYNNVEKIIKVNVVKVIKDTLKIIGEDTHKIGKLQQYTIENPTGKDIKCTLNVDSSIAKIRETTNTSVMILATRDTNNIGKTYIIRVELVEDKNVFVEKEITLKPQF